jgi:hypothetical protein
MLVKNYWESVKSSNMIERKVRERINKKLAWFSLINNADTDDHQDKFINYIRMRKRDVDNAIKASPPIPMEEFNPFMYDFEGRIIKKNAKEKMLRSASVKEQIAGEFRRKTKKCNDGFFILKKPYNTYAHRVWIETSIALGAQIIIYQTDIFERVWTAFQQFLPVVAGRMNSNRT